MIKIVFYGPLASKIDGGFDRMNNNIVNAFRKDPDIGMIALPTMKNYLKGTIKIISYPVFMVISLFRELIKLAAIIVTEKPTILHATPMNGALMYRDICILLLAKFAGIKVIYDIRAGCFIEHYQKLHLRWIYSLCLKYSDQILVEGKKYIPFLDKLGYKSKYFPNYTDQKLNTITTIFNNTNSIKFIYVGRVVPSKGISESIEILKNLSEMHRIKLTFDIIGGYEPNYYQSLCQKFGNFMSFVTFHGYLSKEQIDTHLATSDFFMFLSTWRGEGHSNAINEAMSAGVPVFYYDHGFTREIIENDRFILTKCQLSENVKKTYELIMDEKAINIEKIRLQNLVKEKYSLTVMKPYIKKIYVAISGSH